MTAAGVHATRQRPGSTPGSRGGGAAGTRRTLLAMALWAVGTLVVAAGLVAVDRAWLARNRVGSEGTADLAVRVAGAVRSISGTESVRESTYDATTRSARVWVTSRYYDPMKSLAENKEYLATEGRMAAQLALFGNKDVQRVTIALYSRRTLLATVTGRQGDAFDRMTVVYSGPLVQP